MNRSRKGPGIGRLRSTNPQPDAKNRSTHCGSKSTSAEPGNEDKRMKARFELKKTSDGEFMFNLKAANQEIILTSQMYQTRQSAEEGIASVAQNAPLPERYEKKVGVNGKPYFVLHAANHFVIGRSEMYASHAAMEKGIASVQRNAPDAETVELTAPARA
jgi:uncharacterized protein